MKRVIPKHATLIPDTAKKVFNGVIFDVYQWPQVMFDGSTATFEMLKRPDTVEFLAIKNGQLLMTEEAQPGKPLRLRFPGGRVDPGEDWLSAVRRECHEELGMSFKNWKLIYVDQPATKIEWFCAIYIATEVTEEVQAHQDAGEQITIKPHSFEDAKAAVMSSEDNELSYLRPIFDRVNTLEEFLALPQFTGRVVD